ncbi:hypothetical protein HKX48_002649 [Thoreauomyces humboldtii]|nr:hypothetical protein HKX48_002649 [Thoreauomyces humboldtii]
MSTVHQQQQQAQHAAPTSSPESPPPGSQLRRKSLARLTVHVFQHLFPAYSDMDSRALIHFVLQFLSRAPTNPTTIFLALKYLAAFVRSPTGQRRHGHHTHHHHRQDHDLGPGHHHHQHRTTKTKTTMPMHVTTEPLLLLTSAIALADGFLHDCPLSVAHFAYASGLTREGIVETKRELCEAVQWELSVPAHMFALWVRWLKGFAARRLTNLGATNNGAAGGGPIRNGNGQGRTDVVKVKEVLFGKFREASRVKTRSAALTA